MPFGEGSHFPPTSVWDQEPGRVCSSSAPRNRHPTSQPDPIIYTQSPRLGRKFLLTREKCDPKGNIRSGAMFSRLFLSKLRLGEKHSASQACGSAPWICFAIVVPS